LPLSFNSFTSLQLSNGDCFLSRKSAISTVFINTEIKQAFD